MNGLSKQGQGQGAYTSVPQSDERDRDGSSFTSSSIHAHPQQPYSDDQGAPALPRESSEYPPSRRLSAGLQSYWHRRGNAAAAAASSSSLHLPLQQQPTSTASRVLMRPRALVLCFSALLIILLTVHDDTRSAAHSALTKVGIPLPDEIPDLSAENVKAGIHKWTGGIVGAGGAAWDGEEDDDDDGDGSDGGAGKGKGGPIEWQNTTTPKDPSTLLDAAEPFVNKMVYHPTNGYLLLPDPSKPNAVKAIMEEQHPILELIANAEKKWDELVARQSKTLKEAVQEYKRRYMRNPPKGFEKWWDYAVKNNIVLKDEYDQIHRDMQVFWSL